MGPQMGQRRRQHDQVCGAKFFFCAKGPSHFLVVLVAETRKNKNVMTTVLKTLGKRSFHDGDESVGIGCENGCHAHVCSFSPSQIYVFV